jgi:alpha-beta hydrolase superfamily lysophospholipase
LTRRLLHALLYFPARAIASTPAAAGLDYEDAAIHTADGERLHAWWVPAQAPPLGHVLLCHGNGGNVGDRVEAIALLAAAGFDVLAFDYRGYGRSSGRPSEEGTYRDARAARDVLLRQPAVDPARVFYLGESLGAAVALELAHEHPPAGLILQSPFTSVRDMARLHYPLVPRALVPDAYPSLRLIRALRVPLLVVHGERDEIVPPLHGEALYDAATCPKRLQLLPGVGNNDLVARAGAGWAEAIATWARQ